jgi:spore photoproduct lyase
MEKFPNAVNIETDHYKDIFNRNNQDFQTQKASQKLILAVKRDKLIYEGAKVCQNFGHKHFYYTSSVLNCIYNCDYCYLQGMFPSANIVVFVNIEDYLAQVELLLKEHPIYLTVSYDTDLLAFEGIYPFTAQWIGFAGKSPGLTVEIRTKSANYRPFPLTANENTILAWTFPDEIAGRHEKNTPSLASSLVPFNKTPFGRLEGKALLDPFLLQKLKPYMPAA